MKPTFNQFHFLMSAILFIGEGQDKDALMKEWFRIFNSVNYDDPAEWALHMFHRHNPKEDNVYIRETFDFDKHFANAKNLQTS